MLRAARQIAALPGPDSPAEIALAAAIDLANPTLRRQVNDQVALTGLQADPGQDTDHPIADPASVASDPVLPAGPSLCPGLTGFGLAPSLWRMGTHQFPVKAAD